MVGGGAVVGLEFIKQGFGMQSFGEPDSHGGVEAHSNFPTTFLGLTAHSICLTSSSSTVRMELLWAAGFNLVAFCGFKTGKGVIQLLC